MHWIGKEKIAMTNFHLSKHSVAQFLLLEIL